MGVMDLRRNILLNEPHVSTAVGNPVAFNTDVKGLLQQARFDFLPVQSGTGDPSPSNVRPITGWTGVNVQKAGKNLFDKSAFVRKDGYYLDGNETPTEATSSVSGYGTNYIPVSPSTMYIISGETRFSVYFYTKSRTWIRRMEQAYNTPFSFTTPNDCYYIQLQYRISDLDVNTIQLEVGNSNTPYSPYSGTTIPVTFPAVGKNLLDPSGKNVSYTNNTYYFREDGLYLPAGTYTLSISENCSRYVVDYATNTNIVVTYNQTPATFTLTEGKKVSFNFYKSGGIDHSVDGQLEKGSSATTYEPYTNTVYGGHIDLVTGELTVEWKQIDLGSVNYSAKDTTLSNVDRFYFTLNDIAPFRNDVAMQAFCESYKAESINIANNLNLTNVVCGLNVSPARIYFYTPAGTYANNDEFKSSVTGVKMVYELATPILLATLTPQQISALTGNNTIWADTNGDATIKFWSH